MAHGCRHCRHVDQAGSLRHKLFTESIFGNAAANFDLWSSGTHNTTILAIPKGRSDGLALTTRWARGYGQILQITSTIAPDALGCRFCFAVPNTEHPEHVRRVPRRSRLPPASCKPQTNLRTMLLPNSQTALQLLCFIYLHPPVTCIQILRSTHTHTRACIHAYVYITCTRTQAQAFISASGRLITAQR